MRVTRFQYLMSLLFLWAGHCTAVPSLGDIAERFIVGTDFVTRLMLAVCVAVGLTLIILAITYFRSHRQNPKLVPLGKPIAYLILGIILFAIPFLGEIVGETGSVLELKKEKTVHSSPNNIDTPLELGNEFNH